MGSDWKNLSGTAHTNKHHHCCFYRRNWKWPAVGRCLPWPPCPALFVTIDKQTDTMFAFIYRIHAQLTHFGHCFECLTITQKNMSYNVGEKNDNLLPWTSVNYQPTNNFTCPNTLIVQNYGRLASQKSGWVCRAPHCQRPEWINSHQCTSWPFCPLDGLRFFIRRRMGFMTVHFFLLLTIVLFFFGSCSFFPGPDLTHSYPVHFST
jgi:hypothetical protein